ncbi:MAG: MarC family protein [Dehalococcoidia bacterium]|nr:MarC family protein [Dehalococcoidia bacterium]
MGEDLARAFVSFFAIVDPLGNVVVFYLLTQRFDAPRRLQVAAAAIATAFLMLVLFSVGGTEVLDVLGISPDSFQVAAGLLLLPPAFQLITHGQSMETDAQQALAPIELALVPLATPLLAGPGALAAAISFSDSVGAGTTILGLTLVLIIAFLLFVVAEWLFRLVGPVLMRLLSRIVGILLFAIAIDFILEGARAFFDL